MLAGVVDLAARRSAMGGCARRARRGARLAARAGPDTVGAPVEARVAHFRSSGSSRPPIPRDSECIEDFA